MKIETNRIALFLPAVLLLSHSPAGAASEHGAAPLPAQVQNGVEETALTTVRLTPRAEQRLGIKIVDAVKRFMPHARTFSGEVVVSLAGANGNAGTSPLLAGSLDELLRIADAQAEADGRIEQARVQLDAARLALQRAETMLEAEAGSVRGADEARAQVGLAEAALETASARRALLGEAVGKDNPANTLWVRVQVYAGQLRDIDQAASAMIRPLSNGPGSPAVPARVVQGPSTASALAATIDLFYELEAGAPNLRAGERVSAALPAIDRGERLVVPWPAILYDIHGGQWVYENTAPQTFVRRRVQVERVSGDEAILANGLAPGAAIVTDGAAELFGTEFGAGH